MPLPRRILIVKLADLGDVLSATPALRALRVTFPAAQITVLVTPKTEAVLSGSAYVDRVLTFDKFIYDRPAEALRPASILAMLRFAWKLRWQRFDTVVILHHLTTRWGALKYAGLALATGARRRVGLDNGRGWFLTHRAPDAGFGARHEVDYNLAVVSLLGAQTDDTRLEVPRTPADAAFADEVLGSPGQMDPHRPLVAIHPGSGGWSLARRWDLDRFAAVADALAERHGARIVLVGARADHVSEVAARMEAEPINLEGRTTVGQLAAVLRRCTLFIGADSGIMHVAAAAGTPTVAIFGPTNPLAWGPWLPPERTRVLRSAPLCSPCAYTESGLGRPQGCPERTCMRMVTVEQVLGAAEELLEGKGNRVEGADESVSDITRHASRPTAPVDDLTMDQTLACIEHFVNEGQARQVVLVDMETLAAVRSDPILREIVRRAALRLAVGPEVLWTARRLGRPLPVAFDTPDVIERIAEQAAANGWRLFLLGTAAGAAAAAAGALAQRHPGLVIAGTHAGSPAGAEEDDVVALVRQAQPTVLLVGFAVPAQEKWIARNLPRLGVPVSIGVGAAFERIAGGVDRRPAAAPELGKRLRWLLMRGRHSLLARLEGR